MYNSIIFLPDFYLPFFFFFIYTIYYTRKFIIPSSRCKQISWIFSSPRNWIKHLDSRLIFPFLSRKKNSRNIHPTVPLSRVERYSPSCENRLRISARRSRAMSSKTSLLTFHESYAHWGNDDISFHATIGLRPFFFLLKYFDILLLFSS